MMNLNPIQLPNGQVALRQAFHGCEATLVFCSDAQPDPLKEVMVQIMTAYAERKEQDSKR